MLILDNPDFILYRHSVEQARTYRKPTYGVKVSNIPSNYLTTSLQDLFCTCGSCDVVFGDSSISAKFQSQHYYAYVNFDSLENARLAVSKLNGHLVNGSTLSVKIQGSGSAVVSNGQPSSIATTISTVCTVKVTNISKIVTENNLREIFSFSNSVPLASVKLNQISSNPHNFAYVNYHSHVDADRAVIELNGCSTKCGSKLQVKHHRQSAIQPPVTTEAAVGGTVSQCTVKALITQGSTSSSELYSYFTNFGELKDEPKIRQGDPNFAYINFKSENSATNVAQYPSHKIGPGVTVKIRLSKTSSSQPVMAVTAPPRVHAPLFVPKHIPCNAVISSILTSSVEYAQYRNSIAPVSLICDKNGDGVVLFGESVNLPSAESVITSLIEKLQRQLNDKVLELPCMYVPAFSNPALVSSLAEIEQKCMVQLQVQYGSTCTKDVKSFSTMVSSKLVSHAAAAEVSSFGIALYQKKSTSGASNPPVSYVWSWKDDHHVYTQYDSVSSTKISEHYNSSPQGSLHLTIVTKLGSTSYVVDFATMKQTNLETGHIRKIKKSSLENPDSLTWFYEDDSKKMAPYSASECVQIEEMYLSSKPSDLVINGKVYTFDFTTLKQINKNTLYERKIERNAPHLKPMKESFFNLQIEGLQQNIVIAEKMLKEELDKAVVEKIHVLPTTTDNAFQTEVMTTLQKYFVLASVVGDTVQVRGVQGYVEKVMLIVREKTLDFEKECLARASSTPHSASVPSNWEVQTDKFALKEVLHSSSEWTEIENRFHKTLPSTGIVSIKRIQNKWLWDRYSFAKQRMSERNAGIVNEQMLFHGTRETPPEKIYNSEQGFDFRFSTKGMWGTGTYFAINASYSQSYSYSTIQGKQMILASVLTGETYRCPPDGSLKKPPIKPRKHGSFEDELFDSVSGQTKGSDVFIIYDHEKAYPYYLITFNRY